MCARRVRACGEMSSVVVEESIVCGNARKDQARETKKRDSYFLDRILFRV
jgi:hypothetical protein